MGDFTMESAACFIGHRKINNTSELQENIKKIIIELIEAGTKNFIFGDHSTFNSLCYKIVTELKENGAEINRIHFRKDYEEPNDYTMELLMSGYEDSVCPKGVSKAGAASYVERNQAMIRESDTCVFYYNEEYKPSRRKQSKSSISDYQPKSGTAAAYEFAMRENKKIINMYLK